MGFASGEPHTTITASPMLRISKRLIANVFHEPEGEAGTSAAGAARTDAARLLRLSGQTQLSRHDLAKHVAEPFRV
jgi:hypothetical protein